VRATSVSAIDVLITRPVNDRSESFAAALKDHGLTSHHAPLFSYTPVETPEIDRIYQAILVTSAQAFTDLKITHDGLETPIYCVGETTAQAARAFGFQTIICADGTAKNLASLALKKLTSSDTRPVLYLRGEHIAFPMQKYFKGITVEERITYTTQEIGVLSDDLQTALKNQNIGAITFFSARTAQIFMNLVEKYDLSRTLEHVFALCLGESVLECPNINNSVWKEVYVSKTPDQNGMITLCKRITADTL
jgi:uroporphyrinogen-III synthase